MQLVHLQYFIQSVNGSNSEESHQLIWWDSSDPVYRQAGSSSEWRTLSGCSSERT